MRIALIAALGLSLAACGTLSATQTAESADSAALASYAVTGSVLDALEVQAKTTGKPIDGYEAIRVKAWNDLIAARLAIKAGASVAVALAPLQSDQAAAKAMTPTGGN